MFRLAGLTIVYFLKISLCFGVVETDSCTTNTLPFTHKHSGLTMHFKFHWGYLDYLLRRLKTISLKGSVKEKQNIRTMNKKKSGNKQRKNPYPGDIPTNSP